MENIEKKICSAYSEYVAKHRKSPSFKQLLNQASVEESNFYQYFNSVEEVAKHVWKGFMERTIAQASEQAVFQEYGAREKMLSYAYTMLEVLKPERAYVEAALFSPWLLLEKHGIMKTFETAFEDAAKQLINEGIASEEIAQRLTLSDYYHKALWGCMAFVLHFWAKDNSPAQEKTDTAVEKSVNLAFDAMTRGVFDSAFDFGKFLLQQR